MAERCEKSCALCEDELDMLRAGDTEGEYSSVMPAMCCKPAGHDGLHVCVDPKAGALSG